MQRFANLLGVIVLLLSPALQAAPVVVSVDHRMAVAYGKFKFDAAKNTYTTQVRITNRAPGALLSPLRLSFDQAVLKDVHLLNAQGVGKDGRPYFEFRLLKERLAAGATTEPVEMSFSIGKTAGKTTIVARRDSAKAIVLTLTTAQHVSAGTESDLLQPRAEPYALQAGSGKVDVRFSVRLAGAAVETVHLRRIGERNSVAMNDRGRDGDLVARDGIYGARLLIDTGKLKPGSCLRYEAVMRAGRVEAVSPPLQLCVSAYPVHMASSQVAKPVALPDGSKVVPDELLVSVAPDSASATIKRLAAGIGATVVGSIPPLGLYQLRLPADASASRLMGLVEELKARAEVKTASLNAIGRYAYTPSDPEYSAQHGLQRVRAQDMWDANATGSGVTVTVLDSGLDRSHPDFGTPGACQLAENDCGGANNDTVGHGTQVAGVVAAKTNNALGVAGVSHGSRIHSIQVSSSATPTLAEMTQGFTNAAAYGVASVINASFDVFASTFTNVSSLCASVNSAVLSGATPVAVVVNAAGNSNSNGNYYPGRCNINESAGMPHAGQNEALTRKDLLVVVANSASIVDGTCGASGLDQRCLDSNYGVWVDMAAPGSAIRTTAVGASYASPYGTSFASPMVAGAAAILKSCGVPLDQIESSLRTSANVTVPFPDGSSAPRLDIYRAMMQRNHAPASIGLSSSSVNENTNTAGGYEIGILTASDADSCDKLGYSIVGGADAAKFSIGGAGGDRLRLTAGILDYETKASYAVTVRVTDFFGASFTQPFTVSVINLNEAPSGVAFTNTLASTPENGGSVKVADISIVDDALGSNVLSLSGADAASFSLVGKALYFNGGANYEAKSSYSVTVNVDDASVGSTPDASQNFALAITNVNEPPAIANQSFSVNENSPVNTVLGTILASDPDAGGSLSYSITGPNPGGFIVDPASGQLRVGNAAALDYETNPVYTFTVQVSDGALSATATITVNVGNVNEAPTAVGFANTVATTPENGGSIKVADIAVTDDALGTNSLALSGADAAAFSIVGSALYFNGGADFETKNAYSVTVAADDASVGGTPDATQVFNLAITDVNEAPTMLSLANTVGSTPENGGNVKVADIVITDDALGTNSLALAGPDAGSFTIVGNALYFNGGADFESQASYSVTVTVDDAAVGGSPDASQPFTLTITDVNEAPTAVTFSNTVSSTPENGGDIKVADIAINDDALGVNSLSLSGADPGDFSLVGNELHFVGGANYEAKNAYSVSVDVNDPAVGGPVDVSQVFNLAITNVNEAPTISDQTFTHAEYWSGTPFDPYVGMVAAADADAGDTLTFSITAGNEATVAGGVVEANAFAFDAATPGRLVVNNPAALNFEYKPVFNLTVQVTDAGGLSSTATVTVNLADDAADNGDPHISTVDGLHYDFQSAGEFVALRGKDGMEVQVRQTPVSTAGTLADYYSGLTSAVSVNTALAARVGKHRVTYQASAATAAPVLRVDGVVTTLPAGGMDLGDGGRVLPQGGGIQIDFPDQTTLIATASQWSYYNVWWVNFSVHHTTAREGIMGARSKGSWLPRLSNGSALGAMPAALHDRHVELYGKFADSWRVTDKSSLFDYAEGTSTATYTDKTWPAENGPYVANGGVAVKPLGRQVAQQACRNVLGKNEKADCVFDVMMMGHKDLAKGYLLNQKVRLGTTDVQVRGVDVLTVRGEKVFVATVIRHAAPARLERGKRATPTGAVQFMLGGKPLGKPVRLDAKGQAKLTVPRIKLGEQAITARYIPAKDSVLLPSISRQAVPALKPVGTAVRGNR